MMQETGRKDTFSKPLFDEDGYPAEEFLKAIEAYKPEGGWDTDEFNKFMSMIESAWAFRDWGVSRNGNKWCFSTAGWSGNEDIIAALMKNRLFWGLYLEEYRRGGHYVFSPMG